MDADDEEAALDLLPLEDVELEDVEFAEVFRRRRLRGGAEEGPAASWRAFSYISLIALACKISDFF